MDDVDRRADLERRHRALIERDRVLGLEAEAAAARAATDRVRRELEIAQGRLQRKNARIKQLADQLARAESPAVSPSVGSRTRLGRVLRRARVARRPNAVDEE